MKHNYDFTVNLDNDFGLLQQCIRSSTAPQVIIFAYTTNVSLICFVPTTVEHFTVYYYTETVLYSFAILPQSKSLLCYMRQKRFSDVCFCISVSKPLLCNMIQKRFRIV